MNSFGLGLILNFTDNASAGLRNATGAFNDLNSATANFANAGSAEAALMQISVAAGIVGENLYQVGAGITSLFTGIIQSVTTTGSTILSAKTQLGTLYGSMEQGEAILENIKEYAATSIFNFEDLIPSVIMLKANGIEAFDQIATSAYEATNGMEGTSQTLMDYASDLAAFNPQMRNAYGTGVQAAMGALNEYIAEGNAMSLKRGASLDIKQLLGEETADTIEGRSRQVADLIEQLGMVGTTANLASTPMQRLSNVEDTVFNLMAEISNSGVYDKYSEIIEKLTEYIFSIPDEELSNIAKIVSEALVDILNLLNPVIELIIKLADSVRDFLKSNPELAKSIFKYTALAGIFALLAGVALKLMSSLGMLRFSLIMLFKGGLSGGFTWLNLLKNFAKYLLPIIATVALLKWAWDRNFMGIQERTKNTIKSVIESVKLIVDAFTDNTLSEENFLKAKELGILPLIEGILQLKYHWGFFVEGFKKGLDAFFETLSNILVKLGILDKSTTSFKDIIVALIDKMTAKGMTETWEKVGKAIGTIVGWVFLILALIPPIVKAIKIILGVVKIIKVIAKGVKIVIGWLTKIPTILAAIGNAIIWILGLFGVVVTLPAWVVGLIAVAVVAIVALVIKYWDEICAFFVKLGHIIADAFTTAWKWFTNLPWVQSIAEFVKKAVDWVKNAVIAVGNFFKSLVNAVKNIGIAIWNFIKAVIDFFKPVINFFVTLFKSIVNIIKSAVNFIVQLFKVIYQAVRVVVLAIVWVFKKAFEGICIGVKAVGNFFKNIFSSIYNNVIKPFANGVKDVAVWTVDNVVNPALNGIKEGFDFLKEKVFKPVGRFFKNIFEGIGNVVSELWDNMKIGFGEIKDFICDAFQAISDFVTPIIDAISEAIGWIGDGVSNIIDAGSNALSWAGDKLKGAGDAISQAVGLSTGGYVKTEGIAVLHPNEVVVNDTLTKGLGSFLNDYEKSKLDTSPLIQQDIIATDDYNEDDNIVFPTPVLPPSPYGDNNDDNSPMQSLVNNTTNNTYNESSSNDSSNQDNRVTFEAGSIVFNVTKDTDLSDAGLDSIVDKLMNKMARKIQLRNMQTRKN